MIHVFNTNRLFRHRLMELSIHSMPHSSFRRDAPESRSSYLGKALVAHLDILGFKQKFESLSTILDLFNLADNIESAFAEMRTDDSILIKSFSDNVMLVYPIENENLTSEVLFKFVHYVANVQIELFAKFGWVIRGGVAYGDHYHSDITIVSKPLVEAYTIESQKMCAPFVGLSNMPHLPLRKSPPDFYGCRNEYDPIELITIKLPHTEVLCIDYLAVPILNAYLLDSTSEGVYACLEDLLQRHKDFIVLQLETHTDSRVLSKYLTLASYHNNFIKTIILKMQLLQSIQRCSGLDNDRLYYKIQCLSGDLLIYDDFA